MSFLTRLADRFSPAWKLQRDGGHIVSVGLSFERQSKTGFRGRSLSLTDAPGRVAPSSLEARP